MSIAVGQSGDGPNERPRHPGCHGGKGFGYFLDPGGKAVNGKITKWSKQWRKFPAQTITDFGFLAVLDETRRAGSLGAPAPVVLMIVCLFDGE